jgi:hypothetical protein
MPANLRKLMEGVPRPLQLMQRESDESPAPIGAKRLSEGEQMRRLEPLMGLIAEGHVPLDDVAARAVATYASNFHKRTR